MPAAGSGTSQAGLQSLLSNGSGLQEDKKLFQKEQKALYPASHPVPFSFATTQGITIVFSSSGYLDVSVHQVSFL